MEYRIEKRVVEVCNGFTCHRDWRYIAKCRVKFLGLFPVWGLVINAEWRLTRGQAQLDVDMDAILREAGQTVSATPRQ